jgi:tetratricopeptide (TPR) repeat protein
MDALDEAQASAERAVALAPKRAETHVGLGAVAAAQRRRDVAENSLRRALALDPNNAAAQTRLDALGSRPRPKGLTGSTPDKGGSVTHAPVPVEGQDGLERRVGRSLSWIAYLISLIAVLIIRMQGRGGIGVIVLLLAIPLLYVTLFVIRLAPQERRYVSELIGRLSTLRIAALLEAVAIVLALGAGAAPTARVTLSGIAIAAAVIARLLVLVARRQAARASGAKATPAIGNAALLRLVLIALVVGIGVVHQAMSGGAT